MSHTPSYSVPSFLLDRRCRVYRHGLLQLFIAVLTINISTGSEAAFLPDSLAVVSWFSYYLLINAIIYFNLYMLTPRYLEKEKYMKYVAGVVGLMIFTLAGISVLQAVLCDFEYVKELGDIRLMVLNLVSSALSIGLMIAGISTLSLLRHWINYTRRMDELASNTLQSELKHLKRQINPHFLFNMLNNANMLIKKDPREASRLLLKLEDLLRYQINDSSKDAVLLSSDIRFLNDFLNLEKVRRDRFQYTITQEGETDKVVLPPLLFIPFVENAVKHNPDSERPSYVNLFFKVRQDELTFQCLNSKPPTPAKEHTASAGGLGLKNSMRRLELLYPGRYRLEVEENKNCYTVNLHLTL